MPTDPQQGDLLNSWREISAYLGRDVRTVIRWEKERGLPIHRPPGYKKGQTVFASRAELDRWLLGAPATDEPAPPFPPAPPRRARWLPYALASVALAGSAFLALGVESPARAAGPARLARPLTFARTDYSAAGPIGLAAADFDGDSHLDLLFANSLDNTLVFLAGAGDGSFGRRTATPVGNYPIYFAVGHFDGDGKLDVALGHRRDEHLRIYHGDGTGGFRPGAGYDLGATKGIAAADFDRDGHLDLAATSARDNLVLVLLGDGRGGFRVAQKVTTDVGPGCVTAADLNADGRLDLAVCDYRVGTGKTVSFYLGRGDGTFGARAAFPTGGGPLYVGAADFNGDGKPDLATANFVGQVSVLTGNGNGTFQEPVHFEAGRANTFVAIADWDRDGHDDLAVLGMHNNVMAVLLGRGDGTFAAHQDVGTGNYPDVLALGDFDRDGRLDAVVSNTFSSNISVLLNRSAPQAPPGILARLRAPGWLRSRP